MFGIRKKIKRLKKHIKKIKNILSKNIVFSIGENCLADNILARNGLKSFSSPYASARSNIEYILAFEKEDFKDFLNSEFLMYDDTDKNKVGRNKKYVEVKNKYHNSCCNGFEFTHHDVIGKDEDRKKINKRYKRLLALRNKNIIMLYHHRICSETDMHMLVNHLDELAQIYKKRKNNVHIFLFTQTLIPTETQRRTEHAVVSGINCYNLYTMNAWTGENDNYLWARCDNDLLEPMITEIKKKLI